MLRKTIAYILMTGILFSTSVQAERYSRYSSSYYNDPQSGSIAQSIVRHAKNQIGIRYRFGGSTPSSGFDCSGLVQYTHKLAGLTVPRNSVAQLRTVKPVSIERLQPGDLIFFLIAKNQVTHVGIYIDHGRFIHAPKPGSRVKVENLHNQFWYNRIVSAGRLY